MVDRKHPSHGGTGDLEKKKKKQQTDKASSRATCNGNLNKIYALLCCGTGRKQEHSLRAKEQTKQQHGEVK